MTTEEKMEYLVNFTYTIPQKWPKQEVALNRITHDYVYGIEIEMWDESSKKFDEDIIIETEDTGVGQEIKRWLKWYASHRWYNEIVHKHALEYILEKTNWVVHPDSRSHEGDFVIKKDGIEIPIDLKVTNLMAGLDYPKSEEQKVELLKKYYRDSAENERNTEQNRLYIICKDFYSKADLVGINRAIDNYLKNSVDILDRRINGYYCDLIMVEESDEYRNLSANKAVQDEFSNERKIRDKIFYPKYGNNSYKFTRLLWKNDEPIKRLYYLSDKVCLDIEQNRKAKLDNLEIDIDIELNKYKGKNVLKYIRKMYKAVDSKDPREKAIRNIDTSYLVEAAAGSGKTTVLVGRILSMIEKGVPSDEICALTFTKASAEVMEKRLVAMLKLRSKSELELNEEHKKGLISDKDISKLRLVEKYLQKPNNDKTRELCKKALNTKMRISTIDSLIMGLAKSNIAQFNVNGFIPKLITAFAKEDEENERTGIKLKTMIEDFRSKRFPDCKWPFNHILEEMVNKPDIKFKAAGDTNFWLRCQTEFLNYRCNAETGNATLTFAEIEYYTYIMLKNNADLLKNITYKYYLIDEYQDTSPLQMKIITLLSGWNNDTNNEECSSLFVVGDPKQSIYHFRGADINYYLSMKKEFGKKYEILKLTENYRSNKKIVDYCNSVFARLLKENDNLTQCQYEEMISRADDENVDNAVQIYNLDNLKGAYTSGPSAKEQRELDELLGFAEYRDPFEEDDDVEDYGEDLKIPPEGSPDELKEIIKKLIIKKDNSTLALFNETKQEKKEKFDWLTKEWKEEKKYEEYETFNRDIINLCYNEKQDASYYNKQVERYTIFQSKGLEANTVIVFDPYQMFRRTKECHIYSVVDEEKGVGYLFDINIDDISDEALKKDFKEAKDKEIDALIAENYRKLYVAATRARKELLIIKNSDELKELEDRTATIYKY